MFWVFDEVKRGIYKRSNAIQKSESRSGKGADVKLPLGNTLAIRGIKLKCFYSVFLFECFSAKPMFVCLFFRQ